MSKIIAAGHVCIDITPVFPAHQSYHDLSELLIPGKLIRMEAADVHAGGSVANTGLALKLLGNDVQLLGKVGCDAFGSLIRNIFSAYGADGLLTDPDSFTSYSVVLAVPGIDRVFLHNPGANDSFSSADIPEEALEDTVLFHFGYPPLMKTMYAGRGAELIEIFRRMKAHGIATSLDFAAIDPNSEAGKADWRQILRGVLPYVDFFVPSFEELCFMLDRSRYERLSSRGGDMTEELDLTAEADPLAEELLDMGCKVVVIKCGTSGMIFRTAGRDRIEQIGGRLRLDTEAWSEKAGHQPCFRADIVRSGTGAGDTSIAAFLTAMLQGFSPAECVRFASAEGASCVTAYDALSGLKTIPELDDRIRRGWETM